MKNATKRAGAKSILSATRWRTARAGSRFIFLSFCAFLLAQAAALAQTTVNLTAAGTLKDKGVGAATSLVVTGPIDARDVKYMRDNMTALTSVDLSGANVVAYTGTEGPVSGSATYPANQMPQRSFSNGSAGKKTLSTMMLPMGLTSIGSYAFSNCSGFTGSLTLPSGVTSIGSYAFINCSGFTGSLTLPTGITSIGERTFFGCRGFTGSLTLPNGLTSIGSYAFCGSSGFNGSLTLSSGVIIIAEGAFSGCSGFTGSLTLPSGVTSIGSYAFYGCSGFNGSLTLPTGLISIGSYAFENCSGFNGSLTLPTGLISIGNSVFKSCSGFTGSLTLPSGVTSIGDFAFYRCSGFTGSLILPEGLTSIASSAFEGCSGFNGSLALPSSLTTIGSSAFEGCSKLTAVYSYRETPPYTSSRELLDTTTASKVHLFVPTSGMSLYANATGWKNFKILTPIDPISETFESGSGTSLAGWTFSNGDQPNKWHVSTSAGNGPTKSGSKAAYISNNASANSYSVTSISEVHLYRTFQLSANTRYVLSFDWKGSGEFGIDHLVVYLEPPTATPEGKTYRPAPRAILLDHLCLHPAWRTEKVTLPSGIGDTTWMLVFAWQNNNTGGDQAPVAIDNIAVTAIPEEVDSMTVHLTQAGTLNSAVGAVAVWRKLTVTGPIDARDVRFIRNAMYGLAEIDLSGATVVEYTGTEGTVYSTSPVSYPANEMPQCSFYNGRIGKESLTSVKMPAGLTSIGSHAFIHCYNFTGSLTLPSGITSIGNCAFYNCNGLTGKLTLPSGITSIGNCAFYNCNGLTGKLTLPTGLTYLGAWAFGHCSNFTGSLTLPAGITSIGENVFTYCRGFTGSLTLPTGLTSIGKEAFANCRGFTGSLTLPSGVTAIGAAAFSGCNKFTGSLTLPSKVTSVGQSAFAGCSGFNGSLVLPAGLTSIGNSAFASCTSFTAVYNYNPTPATLDTSFSVFTNKSYMGGVYVYVPCASKSLYQSDQVWSEFKDVRCIEVLTETFEEGTGTTLAGWDFASGSQTNKWHVAIVAGNDPDMGGSKAGYISNNGGHYTYSVTSASVAHLHHGGLYLSDGIGYHLTFDWRGVGELGYDDLQVFLVDNATTPAAGTQLNTSSILLGSLGLHPAWRTEKVTLPVLASSGEQRLVFSWRNNGSAGVQPPAAIDNVVIAAVPEVDSLTVHLTQAGTLADSLGAVAVRRKLAVTGQIDARDVRFIRNAMTGLAALDLSGATVVAYTGTEGTAYSAAPVTYPANEMPQYSFYNGVTGKASLTSVKLPAGLTSIGGYACRDCYRLAGSLSLPSGITSIGDYAFFNCNGLTGKLTLPAGLTYLGAGAFGNCYSFTGSLALPAGITSIGDNTFYNCNSLTGTLTLPAKLTSIGQGAFEDCYRLTGSLTLSNSLTAIGERAFYGCITFTGPLNVPSGVTSIGNAAFSGCIGFDGSLTLPSGLTSIGGGAFDGCSGLDTVHSYRPAPLSIDANVFTDSARASNMQLYVPCASFGDYQAASVWKNFGSIGCTGGVPTAPQSFAAAPGNTEVVLSWSAPASDGGSAITGYKVQKDSDGWIAASSSTGHTFTGLTNGTAYTFKVRAVNAVGDGAESSLTETLRAVPTAPQNFTAAPGNTEVVLSWSAPASNGGSAITGYKVQKDSDGWIAASSSTGHTFTGLTNGTAYTFKVRAVNAAGDGVAAAAQQATPRTVPEAPASFVATSGNMKVTLSWSAPASNGGSAITKYEVQKGDESWIGASSDTTYIFTGLDNGTEYTFKVRAVNAAGDGAAAILTETPRAVPDAPTSFAATPDSAKVALSWLAPTSDGGNAITKYEVQKGDESWIGVLSDTTYTFTGLTNGTAYTFKVRAVNAAGNGAAASLTEIPRTVPGAPASFAAASGSAKVTLSWLAPTSNGGSAITKYEVQKDSESWIDASSDTSHTFTGLTSGTDYAFKVRAVNAAGSGAAAELRAAVLLTVNVLVSDKQYDGTAAADIDTAILIGVSAGKDVTLICGVATFDNASVGDNKPVNFTAFTLAGANAAGYELAQPTDVTGSITARPLTVSGTLVQKEKPSDGSDSAHVVLPGALNGVVAGDDVTLSATAQYDNSLQGVGKTIAVTYSLSGADAGSYIAPASAVFTDGKIAGRPLTVSGTDVQREKVYDGSISARVNSVGTLSGVFTGEEVTLLATAQYDSQSAGSGKVVTVAYRLTGIHADRYAAPAIVTFSDGVITAKPLTVSGTLVEKEKVNDGSVSAHVTLPGTLSGVLAGDDVVLSAAARYNSSLPGVGKPITVTYSLTGADAGSYATPSAVAYHDGKIAGKQLTVSGTNVQRKKVYDGSDSARVTSVGTPSGMALGEDVTLLAAAQYDSQSAGSGKVVAVAYSLSGIHADRYAAPASVTYSDGVITAKPLTVSGVQVQKEKVYDGSDSAHVAFGAFSGVVGGDDVALSATARYDSHLPGVGKPIAVGYSLTGADAGSYAAPADAVFSDGKIAHRPLAVSGTLVQKEKVFDGSDSAHVALPGALNGVVSGDDVALSVTARYADALSGIGKPITVGYSLAGADKERYLPPDSIIFTDGKIADVQLTVSGTDVQREKVYDGSISARVSSVGTLGGMSAGEDVTLLAAAQYDSQSVGSGKVIAVSYSLLGADADGYVAPAIVTYRDGLITPKPLTVSGTLVQKEKAYDGSTSAHVVLVGALSGVVGGDDVALSATAQYDDSSTGSGKQIAVSYSLVGSAAASYIAPESATFSDGKIAGKPLTVSGTDVQREKDYDGSDSARVTSVGTLNGMALGEDVTLLAAAQYDSKSIGSGKIVVVCYSLIGDDADGYAAPAIAAYSDGVIIPKPLTVSGTQVQQEKIFDGSDSVHVALTGDLGGVVTGEDVALSATAKYDSRLVGAGKTITATYSLFGAGVSNYAKPQNQDYANGVIMAKPLTVLGTVVTKEKSYDGSDSAHVASVGTLTGVVGGDDVKLFAAARYDSDSVCEGKTITVAYSLGGSSAGCYAPPADMVVYDGKITTPADSSYTILIVNDKNSVLMRWSRDSIGDVLRYRLPCGSDASLDQLKVKCSLASTSVEVNIQPVDIKHPVRRIFIAEQLPGSAAKRYTIMVEKPFRLFSVINEHVGHLRVVHNNPALNGHGLTFSACEWWRKQDEGEWFKGEPVRLYYAAGPSIRDKFTERDSMHVVLTALNGERFETCSDANFTVYGSGDGLDKLAAGLSVYPNPVAARGIIRLKQAELLDDEGDDDGELYTRLYLFDAQGRPVFTGDVSVLRAGLTAPETPGIYHLVLEGKAGTKVMKIAVGQRGN